MTLFVNLSKKPKSLLFWWKDRNLLESDREFLMKFAARLATLYPDALFRTEQRDRKRRGLCERH